MINSFIPATELEQPIRAHHYLSTVYLWVNFLNALFIIQSICRIVSIFVGWQCLKPTTILVLHSRVSHGRLLPQTKVALWNSDRELNTLKSQNSSRCGNSRVVYHAQKHLFLAVVKWDRETSWSNGNVSFIEIFHLCCGSFIIT